VRVILLRNIEKLGNKGDVVKVAEGYGRNYLIPRGLAVEANTGNLKSLAQEKEEQEKKAQKELSHAQKVAERLGREMIRIRARAGEGGKLFGSVTNKDIVQAVRRQAGVKIDKRTVKLQEPIKNLGTYQVKVRLHQAVSFTLQVDVVEE